MTIRDVTTIITSIVLTISIIAFANWNAARAVETKRSELERAAEHGKDWMKDTTAKLNAVIIGIERITGETMDLAKQVDALTERLDRAEL